MIAQIRRLFDLDADISTIEQHLAATAIKPLMSSGLRIPGVWNTWEAGVRAIFGQQISIVAAITLLNKFVDGLNQQSSPNTEDKLFFPSPMKIAESDLSFLKMPESRKETLRRFSHFMIHHFDDPPDDWIALKGIGPWTISYARLRGLSEPDCFLSSDLVIKKAIAAFVNINDKQELNSLTASLSPWGSYATYHCWDSQS